MATERTPNRSGYFTIPTAPDFLLEISKGQMPDYEPVRFVAHNPEADDTPGTIWPVADRDIWVPLAEAKPMVVVSSSALDTGADIQLELVDGEFNRDFVTVTLDGQTPVPAGIWRFCNQMRNVSRKQLQGTVYLLAGDLPIGVTDGVPDDPNTIEDEITTDPTILQSWGRSASGHYTVPANKTLFMFLSRLYTSNDNAVQVNTTTWLVLEENGATESPGLFLRSNLNPGAEDLPLDGFTRFEERNTIHFLAAPSKLDLSITINIDAVLIDNDQF